MYCNIFWKLNEVLLIENLTKASAIKIFAEKWVLMRSIGWIITQVRLSKRLCAASVTLRVAIKHFLFWWITSVCVSMCPENQLPRAGLWSIVFKGKGKAPVTFSLVYKASHWTMWFANLSIPLTLQQGISMIWIFQFFLLIDIWSRGV